MPRVDDLLAQVSLKKNPSRWPTYFVHFHSGDERVTPYLSPQNRPVDQNVNAEHVGSVLAAPHYYVNVACVFKDIYVILFEPRRRGKSVVRLEEGDGPVILSQVA